MTQHGTDYWVCTGPVENWRIGLESGPTVDGEECGIWGTRRGDDLSNAWDRVTEGDWIIGKATDPVSGVVAVGRVEYTTVGESPIWPTETVHSLVFPNRIVFQTRCVVEDDWEENAFDFDGSDGYRAGIQRVGSSTPRRSLRQQVRKQCNIEI